jgi:hypothetical protein
MGSAQSGLAKGGIDSYLGNLSNAANEGLAGAFGNLAQGGADSLLGNLTTQAQQQLGQQGHLTPQEAYQQTQGTLGGFAGRNNVFNQAEAQSFLDRDALVRQRMQQAQQFAGNVEGQRQGALGLAQSQLGQAEQFSGNIGQQRQAALGLAQQFGIGTQGLLQNALNQAQNFGLSGQAANLQNIQGLGGVAQTPNYAGYAQTPNLAAYGAPGASFAPMSAGLSPTSGTMNSLLGFGANIFDANQNAAANQAIAGGNKQSGTMSGILSLVGSVAAAY